MNHMYHQFIISDNIMKEKVGNNFRNIIITGL